MKPAILLAVILALLLAASPADARPRNCRVETYRGRAWLVCPCGTPYQCETERLIPRYRRA